MTDRLDHTTTVPFRGSRSVRERRVSAARLRGPSFVRVLPDVYVGERADRADPALRRRALAVWGGPCGVVGGSPAAHVLRVDTPAGAYRLDLARVREKVAVEYRVHG